MTDRRRMLWPALLVAALLAGCGGQGAIFSEDTGPSPAAPSVPREKKGTPVPGTTVTGPVPFAPAKTLGMRSFAPARAELPAPSPETPRVIPFHRAPPPVELTEGLAAPRALSLAPSVSGSWETRVPPVAGLAPMTVTQSPRAPALSSNFTGLGDPSPTVIPPDTMGAAGPNHLVSTLNSGVGIFSKTTGVKLSEVTLDDFWNNVIVSNRLPPHSFDPKVLYDQHSGRFIAVSLDGTLTPNSWVLLAVSNSSDPTTGWTQWALPANDNDASTNKWADYPGLGVDINNVYISVNLFATSNNTNIYQYSKTWVIPKPQLLAGNSTITRTIFRGATGNDTSSAGFAFEPAHVFGLPSAQYVVHEGYFTSNQNFLRIASITFPGPTPLWTDLGYVAVAPYSSALPPAPQLGGSEGIDTADPRLINVVLDNNGHLFTTHHVYNSSAGRVEVAWYEIDPNVASTNFNAAGSPVQQGRISDSGRFYYYPSIAVNANGDIGIGFSGSSANEYASAFYTSRRSSDPPSTMQPVGLLKAGLAPYVKKLTGTSNRWGDFSATTVDPSDNVTFWTLQEYAAGTNTWGTWWGSFQASAVPAPTNLVAAGISDNQIRLTWNPPTGTVDNVTIERKTVASGIYAPLVTLSATAQSYLDNTVTAGVTYFYRVKSSSLLGIAYSNEASAIAAPPPPAPPSGGGGGGGCAMAAGGASEGDPAPLAAMAILFSPALIRLVRKAIRPFF